MELSQELINIFQKKQYSVSLLFPRAHSLLTVPSGHA